MPTSSPNRTRLLSSALLALSAAGAQAQPAQVQRAKPPEPIVIRPNIAPAEAVGIGQGGAGTTEPVGAPAAGMLTIAPIGGSPVVGAAQATESAALRSSLVLAQLLDGGKSVDALFRSGDLTLDVARYILSNRVEGWGTIDHRWVDNIRRDLAALVWREGGEALHKEAVAPQVLPRYFRLWLADYLSSVGDEQVLAIGEQILKDTPLPLGGDDGQGDKPLVFQTLERMARYLAQKGKHVESAKVWGRLPAFYTAKEWWNADAMIEAGRQYEEAGQSSQSEAAYAQAIANDSDNFASGALWRYGNQLIRQGETDKAQQLLLQVEAGLPRAGSQKGVVASSLLGYAHYLKGEWKEARRNYELCLARSAQLTDFKKQQSVQNVVADAQEMLLLTDRWEAAPLAGDPQRIDIAVEHSPNGKSITRRFFVRMPREMPLTLSSSNPQVRLQIEESPWASDAGHLRFEKQVVVSVPPSLLQQDTMADIAVGSPEFPKYLLHIPLRISRAHE